MNSEICIPYIRVKDANASFDYYDRCLGFHKVSEHRFAPGLLLVIHIERGGLKFMLTEHTGDGAFGICVYCYIDDDVDALCQRCRAAGGHIIQEPEDMPWARDFGVRDPDGNAIRFGNRKSYENQLMKFAVIKRTRGSVVLTFAMLTLLALAGCAHRRTPVRDAASSRTERLSFYSVPLRCPAAPEIGCGSRAKPVLQELERLSTIEEARLSRAGTDLAVV